MQEVPVYVQHIFCTINICRLKRSPAVHCVYQQLRLIEGVCEVSPGRTFDTLLGFFFGGNSRNYCMTAIGTADIPFGADRVDLQYMIFFTKTINKYQQVFVFSYHCCRGRFESPLGTVFPTAIRREGQELGLRGSSETPSAASSCLKPVDCNDLAIKRPYNLLGSDSCLYFWCIS